MRAHILFNQGGEWRGRHNSGKGDKMQFRFFPECPKAFGERTLLPKAHKALSVLYMDE